MTITLMLTLLFISLSITGWIINHMFSTYGLELLGIFMCIIFGVLAFFAGVVPLEGETTDVKPERVMKTFDGTMVYSSKLVGENNLGFKYDNTVKVWTAKEEDIVLKKLVKKSGFGIRETTYSVGLKEVVEKEEAK